MSWATPNWTRSLPLNYRHVSPLFDFHLLQHYYAVQQKTDTIHNIFLNSHHVLIVIEISVKNSKHFLFCGFSMFAPSIEPSTFTLCNEEIFIFIGGILHLRSSTQSRCGYVDTKSRLIPQQLKQSNDTLYVWYQQTTKTRRKSSAFRTHFRPPFHFFSSSIH